ncbi:MAG: hypothetical protein ACREVL_15515, partial [Solimonas sp.]
MELIVLARAIHVMAGVVWAGATFVVAAAIAPLLLRSGAEGGVRQLGMAARRAGLLSGIAALLTVAAGIYLFAVLHPHDASAGGVVLKAGAVAGLLSFAASLLFVHPAAAQLAR